MEQGEIWFVEFSGEGHEYQKKRPAVIIQSDKQLKITNVFTVMPVTKNQNKHPDDIFVEKDDKNNLMYDSVIKVHHIETFDEGRFLKRIGNVEKEIVDKIKEYLRRHFGI